MGPLGEIDQRRASARRRAIPASPSPNGRATLLASRFERPELPCRRPRDSLIADAALALCPTAVVLGCSAGAPRRSCGAQDFLFSATQDGDERRRTGAPRATRSSRRGRTSWSVPQTVARSPPGLMPGSTADAMDVEPSDVPEDPVASNQLQVQGDGRGRDPIGWLRRSSAQGRGRHGSGRRAARRRSISASLVWITSRSARDRSSWRRTTRPIPLAAPRSAGRSR